MRDPLSSLNILLISFSGDSGGPFQQIVNGYNYVIGIVSFGPATCASNLPGIYTRVSDFVPWIEQQIYGS